MLDEYIARKLVEYVGNDSGRKLAGMLKSLQLEPDSVQKLLFIAIFAKAKASIRELLKHIKNWDIYPYDLLALAGLTGKKSIAKLLVQAGVPASKQHFRAAYVSGRLTLMRYFLIYTEVSFDEFDIIKKEGYCGPAKQYKWMLDGHYLLGRQGLKDISEMTFDYRYTYCTCHPDLYQKWFTRIVLLTPGHHMQRLLPELTETIRLNGPYVVRRYFDRNANNSEFPKNMYMLQ